jgi:thioredoxin 1
MENLNEVIHCDESSFDRLINSATKPVLVDFWATWCGPCRAIGPLLEKLAREHGSEVIVAKVNVDDSPALAQQFNITAIPTLLFFKDGTIVDAVRGLVGYDSLVEKVKSVQ